MIEGFMYQTIIKLWQNGKSKKAIARTIGHDIKTVRKIIKKYEKEGITSPSYKKRSALFELHNDSIIKLIEQNLSNIRIFEEIQKNGYMGSYSSLSNFTRDLKISEKVCVRFHTMPGEEAQVDFGEVGRLPDQFGKIRKAWVFNMRLSYSRVDYFEIVFDQKVETFIKCHINAFNYFGGVPQRVKIDNLKSAIINASFYEPTYQNLYEKFSCYYDFEILPCRVRQPQEKGKVESGIKYIQNNFFSGRKFNNYDDLKKELLNWLDNYCNTRIHGTTKEKPFALFDDKKRACLKSLPEEEFKIATIAIRKVHVDCHVTIENNYYSVPAEYVDKVVEIEITDKFIRIYFENKQVALHTKVIGKGQFSTITSHYPRYKYFTSDSREYLEKYQESMEKIGESTNSLFGLIVKENPNSWYRVVRGILNLRKTFPDQVIELSCRRALYFGITSYSKIKSICESGCYNLELPNYIDSNVDINNKDMEKAHEYA